MKKLKVFLIVVLLSVIVCIPSVQAQRSVEDAIEWAEGQIGSNSDIQCNNVWAYRCMHFIGHAYNQVPSNFDDAWAGWISSIGTLGAKNESMDLNSIPRGALVFLNTGIPERHVGLYIGNGEMIHAWETKVEKDRVDSIGNYLGWRWPDGWTDDNPAITEVKCSDLENEYSTAFQSALICDCRAVYYAPQSEYVIWHYAYNGVYDYWGLCTTSFNMEFQPGVPATVLGMSTVVAEYQSITPNPYTQSTDIHITHCKIRPYKEGSWHHEVDVDMAPGQTFFFELEGRVRNKSNYDLEDVDIDYCFVKDDKDFDVQTRRRIDDDQVDIDEAEKESKHTRRSRVVIASDLSQITVSTDGGHSFNLPITQENLVSEEITLYFYLDVETEDGEDRDVSSESKTDEYAKLEIHLNLPQPPPPDLNLSVPFDQEYIRDKTKNVFTGQAIEIPIQINKSGSDYLASNPFVALDLYGPEFGTPQTLSLYSASNLNLNNSGEDFLTIQIDPISIPGDYYLNVCIDPQEYIVETNEEDNCNLINFVVKRRKNLTPIINLFLNSN